MAEEPIREPAETDGTNPPPIPGGKTGGAASVALSLLIGIAGVIFIPFFVHWYEIVVWQNISQQQLIVNALAPGIFFLVIILVALVNPFLKAVLPFMALDRRQTVMIFCLWMLTGVLCYMNGFVPVLHTVGAVYGDAEQRPMMKRMEFRSYMNPKLFLDEQRQDGKGVDAKLTEKVTKEYFYGKGSGTKRIPARIVPWALWWGPLRFWGPFMILMVVFSASLVRTMHRQWSKHELLTYPIAEFANSIVSVEPGRKFPAVFYNKFFWGGFILISLVYLINGISNWVPEMVRVPLSYAHYQLVKSFHFLDKYCGREGYSLFRGMLYPFVAALAVLLPSDISLTCWLGWVLMVFSTGFYFLFTGNVIGVTETGYIQTGMYVAMLAMILWIGRREYGKILLLAVTFRKAADRTLQSAVTACRVFVLAFAGLEALLIYAGMDWVIAFILLCCVALIVILTARMTAEIGIPWLVNFGGKAIGMPETMMGFAAIGPKSLAVIAVVGTMLNFDTTNSIAAQETTYGKLVEDRTPWAYRLKLNMVLLVGIVAALGATTVSTLWDNYSYGARQEKRLSGALTGKMEQASREINKLQIEGNLDSLKQLHGLRKLEEVSPRPNFGKFFLYGMIVIGACTFMRLRFTWWPFHPLPLLLLNEWCLSRLYVSFFVGWIIKIALVKIGGGKVFIKAKPFFIGIIAGQIVMAGIWIVVNAIYFRVTGTQPPRAITFFL